MRQMNVVPDFSERARGLGQEAEEITHGTASVPFGDTGCRRHRRTPQLLCYSELLPVGKGGGCLINDQGPVITWLPRPIAPTSHRLTPRFSPPSSPGHRP